MLQLEVDMIKRRRISNIALFIGLLGLTFLILFTQSYFRWGKIPLLYDLAEWIGLTQFLPIVYILGYAFMFMLTLPAIRNLTKKKVLIGGHVRFTDEHVQIKDRRLEYQLPLKDIDEMNFKIETKVLKKPTATRPFVMGGNRMRIPSKKGYYSCEFDLVDEEQKQQLLDLINRLREQYGIKIEVKDKGQGMRN